MTGLVSGTIDAAWKAIDCWIPLKDSFQRKFKSDDELSQLNLAGIGPGDIGSRAAIAIDLQPFEIVPRETVALNFPIALRLRIWKRADKYRATVDLLEEIVKALFRSSDKLNGKPTFMELATCGPPQKIGGFGVTFDNIPQGIGDNATSFPVCYGSAIAIFLAKNQA